MAVKIPSVSKSTRKVMVDFVVIGDFDKVETIGQYQVEIDVKPMKTSLLSGDDAKDDAKVNAKAIDMCLKSIKLWDLQGEDGEVLPIDAESIANLAELQKPAFDKLMFAIGAVQSGQTQVDRKENEEFFKKFILKN